MPVAIENPNKICGIFIGDLHLDTKIWNKFPSIYEDSCLGMIWCIQIAMKYGVPIFFLGDIFDVTRPQAIVLSWFREAMDWCKRKGIPVYTIQGNHDKQASIEMPLPQALHSHPEYVHGKLVVCGKHRIYNLDYMPLDDISFAVNDIPSEADILCLHQAVRQQLPYDGAWNLDLDLVKESVRLILMGDIHAPVDVKHKLKAFYTGSTHPRDITQLHEPSCIGLSADSYAVERIQLPHRMFVIRQCLSHDHALDILDEAKKAFNSKHDAGKALSPLIWLRTQAEQYDDILKTALEWCEKHAVRTISPSVHVPTEKYLWKHMLSLADSKERADGWYVYVEPTYSSMEYDHAQIDADACRADCADHRSTLLAFVAECFPSEKDKNAYDFACALIDAAMDQSPFAHDRIRDAVIAFRHRILPGNGDSGNDHT